MWKRNKKKRTTEEAYEVDETLLRRISPAGGLHHYESYSRTGTGYESCLHVWDLPSGLNDYWLSKACNQKNTITTISIHTDDQEEIKKNLNKSIEEQDSRKTFAREYRDYYDAVKRQQEMQELYDEISSMNEVIKSVNIRIHSFAKTYAELEQANEAIIKSMETDSYRTAIFLNEAEREWKSMFQPATKQDEEPHAMKGLPLKATLLAAGNAFHFSSLEDPTGDFLGETGCGGNVIFDEFTRNMIRVNSSAVIVGNMRFGKSTLLKLRLKARAIRGDFTRTFDISGEFTELTRQLGGRVLQMDGTDGIINLLEIYRSGDTDHTSYSRHLSKLKTSYYFLKGSAEPEEVTCFIEMLEKLYAKWGLQPEGTIQSEKKQITGLPSHRYPIFSDLMEVIEEEIEQLKYQEYTEQELVLIQRKLLYLDNIRSQIGQLIRSYGYLFNGHTTIDNLNDVKTVTYNLSTLKDLDPQIFDLQLFNTLSTCWDGAITNGSIMKQKWESGEMELEDVIHTLILIDESHRWVNTKKLYALENLNLFLREGPKYFTGIWLASQSIRDYVPEGSSEQSIEILKTIFELAQYKFIFRQDNNVLGLIDNVFNNSLTYAQRNRISRLQRGECILCISGDRNIEFKVYLSKSDEKLFQGGA